jgi:hypothetical protein
MLPGTHQPQQVHRRGAASGDPQTEQLLFSCIVTYNQAVSKLETDIHAAQAQLERISLVAQRVSMSR